MCRDFASREGKQEGDRKRSIVGSGPRGSGSTGSLISTSQGLSSIFTVLVKVLVSTVPLWGFFARVLGMVVRAELGYL